MAHPAVVEAVERALRRKRCARRLIRDLSRSLAPHLRPLLIRIVDDDIAALEAHLLTLSPDLTP